MKEQLLSSLLYQKPIQYLFDIFENESKEICIVGGSVRDTLLGKAVRDIDMAAKVMPQDIIEILKKNNLRYLDYAYKYGSITVFLQDKKFQITALREDINQVGRHTNIIFTENWKKDAARRDFTINAMYLSRDGKIKDFFNGKKDLTSRTIRFIGKIENSIQEDFLRIYRYFRFLAIFEQPKLIEDYEDIFLRYYQKSFNHLSNDLIRQEIMKMFDSSFPLNSFFSDIITKEKKSWVELTKKHFIKTNYEIGLSKCLNKIDLLIN